MPEFVHLEVRDQVALLTLDRPPMNALCRQLQSEIRDAARELSQRADVGAVVIHGGPKVFAAGADIKEMQGMSFQDMVRVSADLQECFTAVAQIAQPTIAGITGYALGGGLELAMCCDLRVMGDNARVGQPEILLGLIPGAGGTQRLPRLVGPSRAKDLIFSGRFVGADEALAMGLVDRVVAPDDVLAESMAWAEQLARGPAIALRGVKRVIDNGLDVDLDTGLELERMLFATLFATEDRQIGIDSFVQNGPGKAEFTGR
ncbi:MAG: enoyl-CoA hydratase/isomerase family protein [Actinomycetales bacterium]